VAAVVEESGVVHFEALKSLVPAVIYVIRLKDGCFPAIRHLSVSKDVTRDGRNDSKGE